jgi:hypothetical protein
VTAPEMRSSSFRFCDLMELRHTTRMIPASKSLGEGVRRHLPRKRQADRLAVHDEVDGRATLDFG